MPPNVTPDVFASALLAIPKAAFAVLYTIATFDRVAKVAVTQLLPAVAIVLAQLLAPTALLAASIDV